LWIQHAGFATAYGSLDYDLDFAHLVNVAPLTHLYSSLRGGQCGVIITGSSAEYAGSDSGNRENELCAPDTPYGLSKLTQTLRARQLAEQSGVSTRVARVYIPFGRLDSPNKLLAQTVMKLRNREVIALSPCEQTRDFLGVGDLCGVYERLAGDLPRVRFDVFNVASGQPTVLRDFLRQIATRLCVPQELLHFGAIAMRVGEPVVSYAAIDKARSILQWEPTPLTAALDRDLLGRA
jgi:nucleoside-diphosphate-sugar epimerase